MTNRTELPEGDRVLLTNLNIDRLRSLRAVELAIGSGVTVLAGPNASGKSNIVDALGFVFDAVYDGVERATGDRGTRAMLHRYRGLASRGFSIGLSLKSATFDANYRFRIGIARSGEATVTEERVSGETNGPAGSRFDFRLRDGSFQEHTSPSVSRALADIGPSSDSLMLSVMGDSLGVARRLVSSLLNEDGSTDRSDTIAQAIVDMADFLGDMYTYRLFPNTLREPTPPMSSGRLVEDGTNLPSVLRRIVRERGLAYRQLVGALSQVVPDIEDVKVQQFSGYQHIQLKHRSLTTDRGKRGWLHISSESDGTVRTLALLVALYQDPPPSLICIEEPEINVHVGALGILADTLNEVGAQSQVVVTSHSSDLLDFFGEDAIRAVTIHEGRTQAGRLRETQAVALREALFSAGELHRIEGLATETTGEL